MTLNDTTPSRVAILKPCCIGDCIMALPAIDALIAAWPEASFDVFVGHHSRAVFDFRPSLRTRSLPEPLDIVSALQLSRQLRRGGYDAVVSLDRSRLVKMSARTSRSSIQTAVASRQPELRHESEVYLDVVRGLTIPTPITMPHVTPEHDAVERAQEFIGSIRRPFAVLHPGGAQNPGANMLDKRWPEDRFVALARSLTHDGVQVMLSGGPGDAELARRVAQAAGIQETCVLAGRVDLRTLAAVLAEAAVYVGPDTGVSHLAAAVGALTIAIFGPTNPRRYRPLGPNVRVLAPAASWNLPDRDLRRPADGSSTVSTSEVPLSDVLDAVHGVLGDPRGCRR